METRTEQLVYVSEDTMGWILEVMNLFMTGTCEQTHQLLSGGGKKYGCLRVLGLFEFLL